MSNGSGSGGLVHAVLRGVPRGRAAILVLFGVLLGVLVSEFSRPVSIPGAAPSSAESACNKDTCTISSALTYSRATNEAGANFLSVQVPIFPLDANGMWAFPKNVTRLWLDVGAHEESMFTKDALKTRPELGVIAFEPMFDKWGKLSTTNRPNDRMFTIPAAVAVRPGYGTFRRAGTDMCSSLKPVHNKAESKNWPGGCTETIYSLTVPTVSLWEVLDTVPAVSDGGPRIEFLKIDAQGSDFDVLKSAGDHIRRIDTVLCEIQVKVELYADSGSKEEVVAYMKDKGFVLASDKPQNKKETEINLFFVNSLSGLDPEKVEVPDEPGRKARGRGIP